MKERPILMSAPMVRAILAGAKTQTRRAMKQQPPEDHARLIVEHIYPTVIDRYGDEQPGAEVFGVTTEDGEWCLRCPYGAPGDRLWVRETWAWSGDAAVPEQWRVHDGEVWFRADPERSSPAIRWRPSIHMPRWASRITLEVTGVRVERLQDISTEDCASEGCQCSRGYWTREEAALATDVGRAILRGDYRIVWEQINGPGSWDSNPWVWCVSFRRLTT